MIIDLVSDLHGYFPELEGGDLLIIAGDLTANDSVSGFLKFYEWINSQNYEKKVVIAGNHDNRLQNEEDDVKKSQSFTYLRDSGTEFEGLKIWGSPWTSQFPGINPKCCAFTRPFMQSLSDRWDLIPDDVDILITHSPPYGVLDHVKTQYGASVGDSGLRRELEERIKPRLHVFGHIHENGGVKAIFKRPGFGTENNTICVNASYVNERYQPVHKPVRVMI